MPDGIRQREEDPRVRRRRLPHRPGERDLAEQGVEPAGQALREHPSDLGRGRLARRPGRCQQSRPASGDQTEQHGERLVVVEHQRRHLVARGQPVAAVPSAHRLDRHVQVEQVVDVAAHGALVDGEPVGQLGRRPGASGLQEPQEGEHPRGRTSHGEIIAAIPGRFCPVLVIACRVDRSPSKREPPRTRSEQHGVRLDPHHHRRRRPARRLLRAGHRHDGDLGQRELRRAGDRIGHAGRREHPDRAARSPRGPPSRERTVR